MNQTSNKVIKIDVYAPVSVFLGIGGHDENEEISMDIKPIRSDDDLTNAFIRLENIF